LTIKLSHFADSNDLGKAGFLQRVKLSRICGSPAYSVVQGSLLAF